eukprot:gene21653-28666_t
MSESSGELYRLGSRARSRVDPRVVAMLVVTWLVSWLVTLPCKIIVRTDLAQFGPRPRPPGTPPPRVWKKLCGKLYRGNPGGQPLALGAIGAGGSGRKPRITHPPIAPLPMRRRALGDIGWCWRVLSLGVALLFTTASTGVGVADAQHFQECISPCLNKGHCNLEEGRCECNLGFKGPACEHNVLSGCLSSDSDSALAFYGLEGPKSCQCWRQLVQEFRNPEGSRVEMHLQSVELRFSANYCFEREGVPPESQYSDLPAETDSGVKWFRPEGFLPVETPKTLRFGPVIDNQADENLPIVVPLGKCPNRSQSYFSAVNVTTAHGLPSNLSGVSDTGKRKRKPFRIYRYELPWHIAFPFASTDGAGMGGLYSAYQVFWERFSADWSLRTENPWEADLYYVPLLAMHTDSNCGDVHDSVKRVLTYIAERYPLLWGRNQGKDHFIWLPGDVGACWLLDEPMVQNPIKIVHFGLEVARANYTSMPGKDHAAKHPIPANYSCFHPKRDIVVPPVVENPEELLQATQHLRNANMNKPRKHLLFFGGAIRMEKPEYSGGARQAFYKHIIEAGANLTADEVQFGGGHEYYSQSTFCLAPYGD